MNLKNKTIELLIESERVNSVIIVKSVFLQMLQAFDYFD